MGPALCIWKGRTERAWSQQLINSEGNTEGPPSREQVSGNRVFVGTFGNEQHFAVLDTNACIQHVWWNGNTSQWNLQQINGLSATRTAPASS